MGYCDKADIFSIDGNSVYVTRADSNSIYVNNHSYNVEIDENWVSAFKNAEKRIEENKKKEELQKKQQRNKRLRSMVKKVIFSDRYTIILWNDGTKTIAECHEDDFYDKEKGILVCMAKKLYEGTNIFQEVIEEYVETDECAGYACYLEKKIYELYHENLNLYQEKIDLYNEIKQLEEELEWFGCGES